MAPALENKHIIVVGAGLAGLTFVNALERFWPEEYARPSITLYERSEQQVASDREGYSIGIRSDRHSGGMQALQKAGLLENLLPHSLSALSGSPGAMNLWDTSFKPILTKHSPSPPPDGLPIADTRFYRPTILQNLRKNIGSNVKVQWSKQCVSCAPLKDRRIEVLLSDGSTVECDLLIAADGANSSVRKCILPNDERSFAGAVFIMGQSKFPDGVPDVIKTNWGLVLGAGSASMFAAPIDAQNAAWSVTYRSKEPRTRTSSFQDSLEEKCQLLEEARERGRAFGAPFQQLIDNSVLSSVRVLNALDKQPIQNSTLDSPIVFIGDSSHALSPFAGNGANLALMDAVDLAEELAYTDDLKGAIWRFDAKSSPRAKKSVTSSHIVIRIAHSTGWQLTLWLMLLRFIFFLSGSNMTLNKKSRS